jgi:putative RNA 2'-phosphotransferase
MDAKQVTKISKLLSFGLRHKPDLFGVELDERGWALISDVLAACAKQGKPITIEELLEVVKLNNKQRFELSSDAARIRARQGHTVSVDLGLTPSLPPHTLFHGTADLFVSAILEQGLKQGSRHAVHLSSSKETATDVGSRHGSPVVLVVDAERMAKDGFEFCVTANGVWLTDHVPAEYLL